MDKEALIKEIDQLHKEQVKAVYSQQFEEAVDIWNKKKALIKKLEEYKKDDTKHS